MPRTGTRYTRVAASLRSPQVKYEMKPEWRPRALRPAILLLTVLVCWKFIVFLQVLLSKSQKEGGIIFAERVENLPLGTLFVHLYLPTVVALVFSIHIAWIDLHVRRCESYYQFSRKDGALGRESLLLQYSSEFLLTVPVTALRRRYVTPPFT